MFVWGSLLVAVTTATTTGGGGSSTTTQADDAKPGEGKPQVTMGAKNFTEQFILGELYKQALEAKGYTVELKSNIGSTEVTDKALTSGKIDLYPEYTGTILSVVAGETDVPKSSDETYTKAKEFMNGRGFDLLEPTPFEDRDALAVTKKFAAANGGLKSNGDLKKLGSKVTLGAAPEFRTRFAGLKGLQDEYGLTKMKFKPLAIGLNYQALDKGRVQTADVFTTDGQLASRQVRRARGSEGHLRLPERRARRLAEGARRAGPGVRGDAQRGQHAAQQRGDAEDELGGRRRQAEAGGDRAAVPGGERPRLRTHGGRPSEPRLTGPR